MLHITILKLDNQQGPIIQHMELCSMLCSSLNGRGVQGKIDTCVCMAELPPWSPETITLLTAYAKSLQSCLMLCDSVDSSPPGSSVHEILQARILEWVAFVNCLYSNTK